MKPALTAGATFAGAAIAGFAIGLYAGKASGHSWWAVVGLFAGVVLGGYASVRSLLEAGK
ncbi:MAG: AtpZ/AtpI family protein [Candidatus Baltobacteraceae bacterium]